MDRSRQFREAAARENEGRSKTGWRYSAELKGLAVDVVHEGRKSGMSWAELSEDLGVSALTLGRWFEAARPARFHPVEVVEDESSSESGALAAITPGGLRIEGLAWAQVLELTRIFR